jgi:outer membrane protein
LSKISMTAVIGFGILFLFSTSGFCADVAKIGTVSFQKIFENSAAGKAAKGEINKEGQRMEADLKSKGDKIKSLQQQLASDAGIMSKEALEEKKWQLNRMVDDVKALKRKYDHQIQEFQMKRVDRIRQEVLKIIDDYGKKEGFLLILENVGVVYAPQTLDITDQIIQIYNAQHAKSASTAKP